eukprot:6963914-Lingulodinium_polyedra.AAC.1
MRRRCRPPTALPAWVDASAQAPASQSRPPAQPAPTPSASGRPGVARCAPGPPPAAAAGPA